MKMRTIGLMLLFVLLVFVALYLYIQFLLGTVVAPPPPTYSPSYEFSVQETGVVDNGENGLRSLYIIYNTLAIDTYDANITAKLYRSEIPMDIYLLDYQCESCGSMNDFKSTLEQELKVAGVIPYDSTLIALKFNQLERIEKKSIIIIPSGRIPSVLFDSESAANLNRLMERGSVVIYIGNDFSLWMTRTGVVEETPARALEPFNVSYIETPARRADSPYTFEGGFYRLGGNTTLYASAISVQSLSNGFFVAFPNALDLGWNSKFGGNGTAAAKDVARFITEVSWQAPLSTGNRSLRCDDRGVINTTDSLFLAPTFSNGGYVRIYKNARALDGRIAVSYEDITISNTVTGRLFNTNAGINGSIIPMKIELHENFSEPREMELFIVSYKDGAVAGQQALGPPVSFITEYKTEKRYTINLSGGNYIIRINDVSARPYAQSLLHLPLATMEIGNVNWDTSSVTFVLLSDGNPVNETEISLAVDGVPQPPLKTNSEGRATYTSRDKFGIGDHIFTLSATGRTFTLKVTRKGESNPIFGNVLNQAIIVVTVLVLIIGLALRRSEPAKYFIDVPDFPPQQKERIPLSRFAIINLMETINKEYRWKWMPLSLQEIKAGVRKRINYQGKPVLISDYNLEKLLWRLSETGEVSKALGFYGLAAWEKQSGKSMRYLSMFRVLRNFLISHAILFTDVGQRQDCDILVNYRGENIFIHIYEGEESIRRALISAKKGKNFVVFEGRDQLLDFTRRLGPESSRLAVALKMEISSRQVTLTHIDSLGPIIGISALR